MLRRGRVAAERKRMRRRDMAKYSGHETNTM